MCTLKNDHVPPNGNTRGYVYPQTEIYVGMLPTLNAGLVAVIFQGIRTSIAKEPYIFVIFQGGPKPAPSGSAHDQDAALGFCQFILILLLLLHARLK